jgi:hypothetical protein
MIRTTTTKNKLRAIAGEIHRAGCGLVQVSGDLVKLIEHTELEHVTGPLLDLIESRESRAPVEQRPFWRGLARAVVRASSSAKGQDAA